MYTSLQLTTDERAAWVRSHREDADEATHATCQTALKRLRDMIDDLHDDAGLAFEYASKPDRDIFADALACDDAIGEIIDSANKAKEIAALFTLAADRAGQACLHFATIMQEQKKGLES
jgi:hypothetical protein